jgi:hypothetical protein
MRWGVEYTNEFALWWDGLDEDEQDSVRASIERLIEEGPNLGRPHADRVEGAKHANMKELRTQHQGRPLRTFFAFDPRRTAILLIAGDKTGDDRFYQRMIPRADALYEVYLRELENEGLT